MLKAYLRTTIIAYSEAFVNCLFGIFRFSIKY